MRRLIPMESWVFDYLIANPSLSGPRAGWCAGQPFFYTSNKIPVFVELHCDGDLHTKLWIDRCPSLPAL